MDPIKLPEPRLAPLPPDHAPELADLFAVYQANSGFIPNSMLIMQRSPAIARAFSALVPAVFSPTGKVDAGFKRLIAFVCSRSAGCRYCMAHQVGTAFKQGVDRTKFDAVWDYQTSPLFTPAERVALDVSVAAGCVPNEVSDEMFDALKSHWSEEQIVEIVAVISLFGFLNRWNDTMATPLEEPPMQGGEIHLAGRGWSAGKHDR